jgi:hypothetical protein
MGHHARADTGARPDEPLALVRKHLRARGQASDATHVTGDAAQEARLLARIAEHEVSAAVAGRSPAGATGDGNFVFGGRDLFDVFDVFDRFVIDACSE